MSKNSKKLVVQQNENPLKTLDKVEDDSQLEAPVNKQVSPVVETISPEPEKKKRVVPPRSEAQKAALAEGRKKGRDAINARNAQIKAERDSMQQKLETQQKQLEHFHKLEFEKKLIKKAIATKKKQIMKDAVLDEISDDETPIEAVREVQKKAPKKVPAAQPVPQQPVEQTNVPSYRIVFK